MNSPDTRRSSGQHNRIYPGLHNRLARHAPLGIVNGMEPADSDKPGRSFVVENVNIYSVICWAVYRAVLINLVHIFAEQYI